MAYDWTQDANCIAAYLFEEASGTITDESSNSIDSQSESGTINYQQTGQFGYAIDFDDGKLDFGDITNFDGISSLSTVTWLNADSWSNTQFISVIRKDGTVTPLQVRTDSDGIYFNLWDSSGTLKIQYRTGNPGVGSFQHIGTTWDKDTDSGFGYLYLDGVGNIYDNGSGCTTPIYASGSNPLVFGRTEGDGEEYYGLMDETAFFESYLDSTDINDIMDNGLRQGSNYSQDGICTCRVYQRAIG